MQGMKRILAVFVAVLLALSLTGGMRSSVAGEAGPGLDPAERAHLRQQIREAHRQRMLERRQSAPSPGSARPQRPYPPHHQMSPQERQQFRRDLHERRQSSGRARPPSPGADAGDEPVMQQSPLERGRR